MSRTIAALFAAALVLCACGDDGSVETTPGTGTPPAAPTTPAEAPEETSEPAPTATQTEPAPEPEPTTESPSPEPEETADGTVITTGDSQFGEMVFDANDQAIYMFDVERDGVSECYDECAVAWPPVLTIGTPQAAGGIDADLLGTTERDDGTIQVTYNDHPLYFYAHEAPGEVKCHNVNLNGGLWYVLQPDGAPAPPG